MKIRENPTTLVFPCICVHLPNGNTANRRDSFPVGEPHDLFNWRWTPTSSPPRPLDTVHRRLNDSEAEVIGFNWLQRGFFVRAGPVGSIS